MLTALHIQDFVLIDRADLAIGEGMTALTGETGAGKSILLDALGLAVGGRAARGAVRHGADSGSVSAVFEPAADHAIWALLEENGLRADGDQIILRRVQGGDGRSRGFVNDQPVSIALLRLVGDTLLEIHGQHDGRGFLSSSAHRTMLDEFGGLEKKAAAVAGAWRRWREALNALDERRRERDAAAREADYLRHVVERLSEIDPQADEETALAARRSELMAAEKIGDDLRAAAAALDDGGVDASLARAARFIAKAAERLRGENDILSDAAGRLDAAITEAGEARLGVDAAIREFGADPAELEAVEERLFLLRGEARKHGLQPDGLQNFLARAKGALQDVESGEAAFEALEKAAGAAAADFEKLAKALSLARAKAAKRLDEAVAKELAPLKLGRAVFQTQIESDHDRPGPEGYDNVEFMVATNPGAPAGPLRTIASGGELSRFVLAMKAALAAKENRTVIIFDEVDAGVGGAVADAVGERLARLAMGAQVLVVTHSPQVAARAGAHWRIEKTQTKKRTDTRVAMLAQEERIEEIARMLSGAEITDEARAAARRLLGISSVSKRKLAKAG
ncbi:MAG: DNA repair protein RecN [Pseudomonadota bacterium]